MSNTSGALGIFNKVWNLHVIDHAPEGEDLLYVDLNMINEGGSFLAFDQMRIEGRTVRYPDQNIAVTDHYLSTTDRSNGLASIQNPDVRNVVAMIRDNAEQFDIPFLGINHSRQGIAHVIGPELGLTQPGLLVTCNDSHTATNGAMGAIGMPVGASNQLRHVLATQTIWQKRPKTMRITIDGRMGLGVTSKDVILTIISRIGIGGASGHAVEYAGSTIRAMSAEERMTICNMSIEAGARVGMIEPDDVIFDYLRGRQFAPKGADWDRAVKFWTNLRSDPDATYDTEMSIDAGEIEPMVSWGTSPEDCTPISGVVPDPTSYSDSMRKMRVARALEYMKLQPGTALSSIRIDRAFLGSCTNSRIEDLRLAASIVKGRKAVIPSIVSPGSTTVKHQAEAEGLDRIFIDAGFEWRESGCSLCVAVNGETVAPGERCASTSNRNFEGRQGRDALTHIMSPAMTAAAALTGKLTDVRTLS